MLGRYFFLLMKKLNFLLIGFLFSFQIYAQKTEAVLDSLLNSWHTAASKANFEGYFNLMHSNFIFLGTDPTERWNKEQFAGFCKPHFEKGKGWDFKKISRNIMVSSDGTWAWFDEHIDTWMKDCRGSGVFIKTKDGWKLIQYNLTVLIENEKIKDFIELRNN